MALAEEKKTIDGWKKKQFHPIYYWVVEETIKADQAWQSLKKNYLGEASTQWNLQTWFGDELQAANFIDAASTVGFFQQQQIFLVKNAEAINAKTWEALKGFLQSPPPATLIVFWGKKLDARLKHAQWLSKLDTVSVVKWEVVREQDYPAWCQLWAREAGVELAADAIPLLCGWAAADLASLKDAFEKARLYAGQATKITADHVSAVNSGLKEENIFAYIETFLARQRAPATAQLQRLLQQGEEPIAILALLARQLRILLQILAMRAEGKNDAMIAQSLRLYPKQAQALFQAAGRWGGQAVIRSLQELAEVDRKMKSSREPTALLLQRSVYDWLSY